MNTSRSYGSREILHDLSFSIPDGCLVNVLGPNGVGKSTLFRCILGLSPHYSGTILVNGKDLSNKKNIARYQILPFLKNRGIGVIDAILISHTDNDHTSGVLELFDYMRTHLTSVKVKNLILPEWTQPDDAYQQLVDKAQAAGVNVQKGRKGEQIVLGKASLRFLSPDRGTAGTDANEDGMVVELTYGGFEGLFTGDIGTETEKKLLPELEDVDFLKVGHHGSRYSTCQEFLDVVRPELAVVSCSATNTYGHPSGETIERLEDSGAKIWYTMKEGAVTAETDGKEVWVDTFVHP